MKLITLNIEGNKHFDTVIPFFTKEMPDVLCLQEVFENDLHRFEALGYLCTFLPMTKFIIDDVVQMLGIALCSRTTPQNVHSTYFLDFANGFQIHDSKDIVHTVRYGLIGGDITHDGSTYSIITTHFTWTPHGADPSPHQTTCLETLLAYTGKCEPHIICGDFNIPRHKSHLYEKLTSHYTDNVPLEHTSSLDRNIHRVGANPEKAFMFDSYMVDYVFTKPPYTAHDVRLQFGVSDHAAVVAMIEKS